MDYAVSFANSFVGDNQLGLLTAILVALVILWLARKD